MPITGHQTPIILARLLFLESLTATLGCSCHSLHVTDAETEASEGSLGDLPRATELEHQYPEACILYTTSPGSDTTGNGEAPEGTCPGTGWAWSWLFGGQWQGLMARESSEEREQAKMLDADLGGLEHRRSLPNVNGWAMGEDSTCVQGVPAPAPAASCQQGRLASCFPPISTYSRTPALPSAGKVPLPSCPNPPSSPKFKCPLLRENSARRDARAPGNVPSGSLIFILARRGQCAWWQQHYGFKSNGSWLESRLATHQLRKLLRAQWG